MLSCERMKADLAPDRNALQTIEKIFVFRSVGESLHKPQIIEIRQIVSRSRSRNQKRRTLRSLNTTTPSLSIKWKLSSRSRKQKRKNRKPITKLGNKHCDWFILPLLLPTPAMWFSLDRKRRCHKQSQKWRKWKRSDSSDSDSVALITPLTSPIFYFYWVISTLYDPSLTTPTPSLVKTSLYQVPTFAPQYLSWFISIFSPSLGKIKEKS